MPRLRNWVMLNPLLRKGGVHKRARSSERHRLNLDTQALVDEWQDDHKLMENDVDNVNDCKIDKSFIGEDT